MKVSSDYLKTSGTLVLYFQPNGDDEAKIERSRVKLARPGASFVVGTYDVHPDVYALACLTIIAPFTHSLLELDEPVSVGFRDLVRSLLKIDISPVSDAVQPRAKPVEGVEGLSFSGGVDSVAALKILPYDSVSVFSHRLRPRTAPQTLYRSDAALNSCRRLAAEGRTIEIIENTAEHARYPAGFSTDWTTVTGALFRAEELRLASLNFGMIAEAAYRLGHPRFSDVGSRGMFRDWRKLFAYVNVPLSLPTAGLSEVITSRIALEHAANLEPQSCVRGRVGEPCNACYKCFRKQLLTARLQGNVLPDAFFDNAIQSAPIRTQLAEPHMHLENVIAYAVHGIRSDHPLAMALRRKTQPIMDYAGGLTLLERHYGPSISTVADHLQASVSKVITQYAGSMDEAECKIVTEWDLSKIEGDDRRQRAHQDILRILDSRT